MIPYFEWRTIPVGPVLIQVWGLFVALGVALGLFVASREVRRRGLDAKVLADMALIGLLSAFVGARLVHVFAYASEYYFADPGKILAVWEGGLSSFGGFFGAVVGVAIYVVLVRLRERQKEGETNFTADVVYGYVDAAAYALPLAYGCGRIGCFLIHDHPGTLSHSVLAVQYPGGARLDHGLLLSLLGFAMFLVFWLVQKKMHGRAAGLYVPMFLVMYGAIRFVLDFFRAWDLPGSDVRYFLFTPAQYGAVVFVFVGIAIYLRRQVQQK